MYAVPLRPHLLSDKVHKHYRAQADMLTLYTQTHTCSLLCKLISVLGGRVKLLIIRLMGTRLSSASLSSNWLCVNVCVCVFGVSEGGGTSE